MTTTPHNHGATTACQACRRWFGTRSGTGWCIVEWQAAVRRVDVDTCDEFKPRRVTP